MREIKFRVWTGVTMEHDVTVGRFGAFYVNPGSKGDGLDENDSASLTEFNTRYSDEMPVMQFSGVHDKNGKEIYEGDILTDETETRFAVEWQDAGFVLTHDYYEVQPL